MRTLFIVILCGFGLVTLARADTDLRLRSNTRASVYLDGRMVGQTPLDLAGVEPGDHRVRVVEAATGETKDYRFLSPNRYTATKRIDALFGRADTAVRDDEPGRSYGGRRIYYDHHGRRFWLDSDGDRHYLDHNDKARVRNVGIGATVLGAATGSRFLTGLGIGGIIANEAR